MTEAEDRKRALTLIEDMDKATMKRILTELVRKDASVARMVWKAVGADELSPEACLKEFEVFRRMVEKKASGAWSMEKLLGEAVRKADSITENWMDRGFRRDSTWLWYMLLRTISAETADYAEIGGFGSEVTKRLFSIWRSSDRTDRRSMIIRTINEIQQIPENQLFTARVLMDFLEDIPFRETEYLLLIGETCTEKRGRAEEGSIEAVAFERMAVDAYLRLGDEERLGAFMSSYGSIDAYDQGIRRLMRMKEWRTALEWIERAEKLPRDWHYTGWAAEKMRCAEKAGDRELYLGVLRERILKRPDQACIRKYTALADRDDIRETERLIVGKDGGRKAIRVGRAFNDPDMVTEGYEMRSEEGDSSGLELLFDIGKDIPSLLENDMERTVGVYWKILDAAIDRAKSTGQCRNICSSMADLIRDLGDDGEAAGRDMIDHCRKYHSSKYMLMNEFDRRGWN